jgi:serine/threonine-protein kinase
MARFRQEASAAANIGHRGIVDVLDAGICEDTGALFIAMELLQGEDLRSLITREPRRAFDAVLEALHPLAALHARGFVHRDLKPENLFLAREPGGTEQVKILDFGIARSASVDARTATGASLGTPGYMAPEQVQSARDASAASDVWAVGIMIYEAVAGSIPFDGPTGHAVMIDACRRAHQPLIERIPTVDPGLSAVVDACLAKDPDDRPPDAGALRERLAALGQLTIPEHEAVMSTHKPTLASDGEGQAAAFAPTLPTPSTGDSLAYAPTVLGQTPRARTTGAVVHTPPPEDARRPRATLWLALGGLAALGVAAGMVLWLRPGPEPTTLQSGGLAQSMTNPEPAPQGFRRVHKGEWSVDLPKEWKPSNASLPSNLQLVASAPGDDWVMAPRIHIQVDRFEQSLSAYVVLGEHNMEAGGATIHERFRDPVGVLPGAGVDVTFSGAPKPYRMMNRATVAHGFGYHADCIAAEEDWPKVREVCARIVDSFWVNP